MKHVKLIFLPFFALLLATGCGCDHSIPSVNDLFSQQDSRPPMIVSSKAADTSTVVIQFDENLEKNSITLNVNGVPNTNYLCNQSTLSLFLFAPMKLATFCNVEGRVEDKRGNSTRFSLNVWAKNTNRASVIINEFSTKGSTSNPDRVELLVTKGGNLAGITLANGSQSSYTDRCILPDLRVYQGDYLVVSFQKGEERTQFSSEKLVGLGSNNGCLTICESPDWESALLDAVLYSNLTTSTYNGFGSRALEEGAKTLYEQGQWTAFQVEGAINSSNSTATRTLCRNQGQDTNSKEDWYVCDTKEASFGTRNSSKHFIPAQEE